MRRTPSAILVATAVLGGLCASARAVDLERLTPIGSLARHEGVAGGVLLHCADGSEVRLTALAPDLIRVRVSFAAPLPALDHSWAIDKTDWAQPRTSLSETPDGLVLATDEVEVAIRRSPLLIAFRDVATGRVINEDFQPMAFDASSGALGARKRLGLEEYFYGLGEKAAPLNKRRGRYVMWSVDTPAYRLGTDPLYQSIPFYLGLERGVAYGIFFDNSYRTEFAFGATSQEYASFAAEGGALDYYYLHGPAIKKILARYTELTGRMPMMPLWALGHQQCRWSYYPAALVESVVDTYRRHDLPLDAVYLDIHYMDGYRVFTFDGTRFPDPKAFTARLAKKGVKVVAIVDPGIKYQPPKAGAKDAPVAPELTPQADSYYVFNQGLAQDLFLKRRDGKLYIPRVWPGDSVFVDYTLPEGRRFWGDLHRAYVDNGIAGIWNDMNEPSDFGDQTGQSLLDVVSDDLGQKTGHAKNRNLFGLLMSRATYEGLARLRPDSRPFVISRSGYAGLQRYATVWTGDNVATWEHLWLHVAMLQGLGLSGQAFVGADIGGFFGRGSGELLARWYQVAFLTPLFRNHKSFGDYDAEPWRFGPYYEDLIRKYIKLRYRLLPFLYTRLEEAHATGVPPFRPLLLNYQDDPNVFDLDTQLMVGDDLLAAPILREGATERLVYLPRGVWYDFWTGERLHGGRTLSVAAPLEKTPLFVRGGAVLPLGPEMSYTSERPRDPLTLLVYPDEQGSAASSVYEDDGETQGFSRGAYRRTEIKVETRGGTLAIEVVRSHDGYSPGARQLELVLKTVKGATSVRIDGRPLGRLDPATSGQGWWASPEGLTIRLADDAARRLVEVRP